MEIALGIIMSLVSIIAGYIIGLAQNGVNVTINHHDKSKELPVNENNEPVYNKSYEDYTDQEARNYLELNKGTIKI